MGAFGAGWDRPPRHALVLAGGGVVGGLYELGALLALDELFDGFTTRDFDLYVGSSAGAVMAALLANGVTPAEVREALEHEGPALPRLSGARLVSLPWRQHLGTIPALAAELPRLLRDLAARREARVLDTLAALAARLPHGLFSLDALEGWVREALTRAGHTNVFGDLRRRLVVPATVLDTGAIHAFGLALPDPTPISAAVAASAAIPLLFEPVRIDGVDYVDAAITKTAHAGLAIEHGAGLVVIVHPIRPLELEDPGGARIRDGGMLAIAGQAIRIVLHRRLREGVLHHAGEHAATDVVVLEPYPRDGELFDYALMAPTVRYEIVRRGYRTTAKTILADFPRHAAVFARVGVGLVPREEFERRARRWSREDAATRRLAAAG
jgi:predicted acylesterase/phospholipase RssA